MTERGSASVVMLGFITSAVIVSFVLLGLVEQVHVGQRLQGATDRAALGSADALVGVSPWLPCDLASEILAQEGFELVLCELEPRSVRVVGEGRTTGVVITRRSHAGVVDSGQG
jgi:secretion/DNA translocation related TadE-like protein